MDWVGAGQARRGRFGLDRRRLGAAGQVRFASDTASCPFEADVCRAMKSTPYIKDSHVVMQTRQVLWGQLGGSSNHASRVPTSGKMKAGWVWQGAVR